jgi:4-phytase/acid phosphatase
MGNQPTWFSAAFARPLAKMETILNSCASANCPPSKPDFRDSTSDIAAGMGREVLSAQTPVSMGADFAEHFLLEYTEGMPMPKVGWGQVTRADLDDLMEMNTRFHDFMLRTPAYAQAGGSNLAGRILATLERAAGKQPEFLPLGDKQSRLFILQGHDSNLTWLGGLLHLDWLLPDQTFNATPPGSALTIELYRNRTTGTHTIRIAFISQTLDQIRNLQVLTGSTSPAIAPVFIPGCSSAADAQGTYPCSLEKFSTEVMAAIDTRLVERGR